MVVDKPSVNHYYLNTESKFEVEYQKMVFIKIIIQ